MTTLIGQEGPDFIAPAVLPSGKITNALKFSEYSKEKYSILLFYPLDFTFVCPSELISLNKRIKVLESLGVKVLTVSIDSHFTHNAWRNTEITKGGIGHVNYAMVSDVSHKIVESYGVENKDLSIAYRATFLMDRCRIVRHQVINDLSLGRNMDELVRMVHALQFSEKHGEVCPAGWNKGDEGMSPSHAGTVEYLTKNIDKL